MVDKYYIAAPWLQEDRGDGLCWYPPPNTVGLFDMRGKEQPLGFFCVSKLSTDPDYTLLGKGDIRGSIEVSTSVRAFWREFLGLTIEEMPDSTSQLSEMLIKTIYYHGDPEGAKRFYPPTIASDGTLAFFLSGHARPGATFDKNMLHRRKFTGKNDPAFKNIQRHYQNIYQTYYDENELARFKVLSDWERTLGVPAKDLQPFGINEKAIKPETLIDDDFARGNQDLEDSADWDQVDGSMIIVSEEVQTDGDYTSFPTSYRNTNPLLLNHYAQLKQVNKPSDNGGDDGGFWSPAIRFAAGAESYFYVVVRERANDADVRKVIEGTDTNINLDTYVSSWPQTVKLQKDGLVIKLFVDGSEESSFSDPSLAGNLRTGINTHRASVEMGTASCDDFEAADLAAGIGISIGDVPSASTFDVSSPTFVRIRQLSTDDVPSSTTISTDALVRVRSLLMDDVGSASSITSMALVRIISLILQDTSSTSTIDTSLLARVRSVALSDVASTSLVVDSLLARIRNLSIDDVQSATQIVDLSILALAILLSINDVTTPTSIEAETVTRIRSIVASAIESSTTIDSETLTRIRNLSLADVSSSSEITDPAMLVIHVFSLVIDDVLSSSSITGPQVDFIRGLYNYIIDDIQRNFITVPQKRNFTIDKRNKG